ncbi:MAG: dephospho-CoA kinase [Verrucomicrobiia bacterium]
MVTLGLTGGIGMGKSTAATILLELYVPVIDTDVIARQIVEPGQPALAEIRAAFGSEIIASDGSLRRNVLAERVFSDPSARRCLEAILHPRIRDVWQAQVRQWSDQGRTLSVVVIPLLFEVGAQAELNATVCVACSAESQMERLCDRGWTAAQIQQRIQSQWPVTTKMEHSNFVVWAEGTLETTRQQLRRILTAIES